LFLAELRYVANPFAFAPPAFAGNRINVREGVTRLCEVGGSACAKKTSGPIPKFASIRCPFRCERRNLRTTSFGFGALAGNPFPPFAGERCGALHMFCNHLPIHHSIGWPRRSDRVSDIGAGDCKGTADDDPEYKSHGKFPLGGGSGRGKGRYCRNRCRRPIMRTIQQLLEQNRFN
jgi:hypothetical protein